MSRSQPRRDQAASAATPGDPRRKRAPWYIRWPRMLLGFVVTLVGVVLLPLPGPGWVIIAAGLSILARDLAWADRLLQRVRRRLPRRADGKVRRSAIAAAMVLMIMTLSVASWFFYLRE